MAGLLALVVSVGCDREEREFQGYAAGAPAVSAEVASDLRAGPVVPNVVTGTVASSRPAVLPASSTPYQENAYAIGEGKLMYTQFNCNGCHGMGGGAIGPPLMDAEWRYGSDPENIRASIIEGRPNGMPSFRGRISEDRVWWLVAYVRSMSGLVRLDARPGRSDAMHVKSPEVLTDRLEPRPQGSPPAPAER